MHARRINLNPTLLFGIAVKTGGGIEAIKRAEIEEIVREDAKYQVAGLAHPARRRRDGWVSAANKKPRGCANQAITDPKRVR